MLFSFLSFFSFWVNRKQNWMEFILNSNLCLIDKEMRYAELLNEAILAKVAYVHN